MFWIRASSKNGRQRFPGLRSGGIFTTRFESRNGTSIIQKNDQPGASLTDAKPLLEVGLWLFIRLSSSFLQQLLSQGIRSPIQPSGLCPI